MLREMCQNCIYCYRDDRKRMAKTLIAFALTCLCMLALVVILSIQATSITGGTVAIHEVKK